MEKNSIALITAKCILKVFLFSHIKLMIAERDERRYRGYGNVGMRFLFFLTAIVLNYDVRSEKSCEFAGNRLPARWIIDYILVS